MVAVTPREEDNPVGPGSGGSGQGGWGGDRMASVVVRVLEDGVSAEVAERAGESLREELLELDVESVRRLSEGTAPAGSRGVDIAALGGLLVSLPATPSVLSAMVETVRGWLRRGGADSPRSVHLEIDGDVLKLGQATADQQERLVQDWLRRRGGTDGDGSA